MSPRILALGDVGSADFHLGDQAMLDANLALVREELPDSAVEVLGRAASPAEIAGRVGDVDAVLISGGGNLSSTWPELLEQRITLLESAAAAGVAVAMGGQTIGPVIAEPQRSRLSEGLRSAALVGVRERPSAELARSWGVPADRLVEQVDDAFFIAGLPPQDSWLHDLAAEGYIAVTLDGSYAVPDTRPGLQSIAAQLAVVGAETGLAILTVPHVGRAGTLDGDDPRALRQLAALVALAGGRVHQTVVPTVSEAVWIHRAALLTVSTRYHPLVFASSVGMPCLGLVRDAYTRVKLAGALAHVGEDQWVLDVAAAERGDLVTRVRQLMSRRRDESPEDRARRDVRLTAISAAEASRRTRLVSILSGNVSAHDDQYGADDGGNGGAAG